MYLKIFIILFAVLTIQLNAKMDCSKETVCIETKQEGDLIKFYAHNKKHHKVTIYVTVQKQNMHSSKNLPLSLVLNGKEKQLLFTLRHGKKSWSYRYHYSWTRGDYTAVHNNTIYNLPYAKGSKYKIAQSCNGTFSHSGSSKFAIDFKMPINTPIHAAREGKVVDIKDDSNIGGNSRSYIDDGNYVIIEHDDGTLGEYWHLKQNGVSVKINQYVQKGDLVGYSGNTGFTRGPHLHFVVKSASSKGKSLSYPVKFNTDKGVLTCPKEDIYLLRQ